MAGMLKLEGTEEMIRRLKKEGKILAQDFAKNVKKAGLYLQRESQKIVPVDLGNLKGSAFTRWVAGKGWSITVVVGYTANYAIYVHEDLNARHKPGKVAKYLERPLREKRMRLLEIMEKGR